MTITPRVNTYALDRPLAVRLKHVTGRIRVTTSPTAECKVTMSGETKEAQALVDDARIAFNNAGPIGELDIKVGRRNQESDININVVTFLWAFKVGAARSKDKVDVHLEVPAGTTLDLSTVSGEIDCTSAEPGRLEVASVSGHVHCGKVSGPVLIKATSGTTEIGEVHGSVDAKSVSGSLRTGVVHGSIDVKSVSGSVKTCIGAPGRVQAKTVSGDITINVVPGMAVSVDAKSISGALRSTIPLEVEEPNVRSYLGGAVVIGDDPKPQQTPAGARDALVEIAAQSVSGDVLIGSLTNA